MTTLDRFAPYVCTACVAIWLAWMFWNVELPGLDVIVALKP